MLVISFLTLPVGLAEIETTSEKKYNLKPYLIKKYKYIFFSPFFLFSKHIPVKYANIVHTIVYILLDYCLWLTLFLGFTVIIRKL